MGIEIERKFLVHQKALFGALVLGVNKTLLTQGYLSKAPAVRVRVQGDALHPEKAWLTVKGKGGLVRPEYEYEIHPTEGAELVLLCKHVLRKNRYLLPFGGFCWEIDEFLGNLGGLWLAEVELDRVDEPVTLPPWVEEEVTDDHRYSNLSLAEFGCPPQKTCC